ncbi:MAG: TRAP transporter TatT component family protein [Gammaproteobacteria bacterium]|nr:TRAP transporter TatT component family protein [Gammaproteobacteria bacterium]
MFKRLSQAAFLLFVINVQYGCSMDQMVIRAGLPMIEGGIVAMQKEPDLELAKAAFPVNIEMIEGMLVKDPRNEVLRQYTAQAYYGYAYSFIEDHDPERASKLYYRGYLHGMAALAEYGLDEKYENATLPELQSAVNDLDDDAITALFWTASNLAKWIDMNRDNVQSLSQLSKAVMFMQRVLELDENFFMAGPHVFFAVYYGSRPPMAGGNYALSEKHFEFARNYNKNKLLLVDVLQAQYLDRQRMDRTAFNKRLNTVIKSADDLYPEQAMINSVAMEKALLLLKRGEKWF